jgi:hypothetical protein
MIFAIKFLAAEQYGQRSWYDWREGLYCDRCGRFGPHGAEHECLRDWLLPFPPPPTDKWWTTLKNLSAQFQASVLAPDRVYRGWKKIERAMAEHPKLARAAAALLVRAGHGNRPEAPAVLARLRTA